VQSTEKPLKKLLYCNEDSKDMQRRQKKPKEMTTRNKGLTPAAAKELIDAFEETQRCEENKVHRNETC
jgi:hypothetical protein